MSKSSLTTTICNGRNHVELTYFEAYSYCTLLSVSYVASLYCLVPPKVRQLQNRDDPIQIQWRGFATSIVCIISLASYGTMFCEPFTVESGFVHLMNWNFDFRYTLTAICGVVFHVSILYFGVYLRCVLLVYEAIRKQNGKVSLSKLSYLLFLWYINPIYDSIVHNNNMKRWIVLRNLLIAPMTEEIVFRSCMVSALTSTGMTSSNVCLVAPLFFGFAHLHHAILKLHQCNPIVSVALTTLFQFLYTSIFGAYVSYVYQRSTSLVTIVVCHSMCNGLGIPDLSFLHRNSSLYPRRLILLASLMFGFAGFIVCMAFFDLPTLAFAT
jgi:prenyl protein peptidase